MKKFLAAALLSAGLAAPAHAASFIVTDISAPGDTPAVVGNAFAGDISGAGFDAAFFTNVGLALDNWVIVDFYVFGSESNFQNGFTAGPVSFAEAGTGPANDLPWQGLGSPIGSGVYGPGQVDWTFNVVSGIGAVAGCTGAVCGVDTQAFGIFSEVAFVSGSSLDIGGRVIMAFDDDGAGPDDNHDDLLIGAVIRQVVPEPATWSLMIAAFGLLGYGARRRVASVA